MSVICASASSLSWATAVSCRPGPQARYAVGPTLICTVFDKSYFRFASTCTVKRHAFLDISTWPRPMTWVTICSTKSIVFFYTSNSILILINWFNVTTLIRLFLRIGVKRISFSVWFFLRIVVLRIGFSVWLFLYTFFFVWCLSLRAILISISPTITHASLVIIRCIDWVCCRPVNNLALLMSTIWPICFKVTRYFARSIIWEAHKHTSTTEVAFIG